MTRSGNPDEGDLRAAREAMVARQIVARGIVDTRVIKVMRQVPRDRFVAPGDEAMAYADRPLPIGHGQTVSQPFIVALMIQLAELRPGDTVLEIGCGSGYAAAVLSRIAARVFTIERHPALAVAARRRLAELRLDNIEVVAGDGTLGLPRAAPFDAILSAAAGPNVPRTWQEQLAVGGRLVMPVGTPAELQELVKVIRITETDYTTQRHGAVRFVPLIGAHGHVET